MVIFTILLVKCQNFHTFLLRLECKHAIFGLMEVDKVSETRQKLLKASQQVSRTCQSGIMMEAPVIRYNMIHKTVTTKLET